MNNIEVTGILFENIKHTDEKGLYQRNLTRKGNYDLNQTAKKVGVKNFDKFHNYGYKGLRYKENILDNMGSEKRNNIQGENNANKTHYNMGKDFRKFIENQKMYCQKIYLRLLKV